MFRLSLFPCSTRWCWHRRLTERTAVSLGELTCEGEKKDKKCWQIYTNLQPVSEGREPTDYNRTGFRFQDPKSHEWFYLTIGVSDSSLDAFKKSADTNSGIEWEGKVFIVVSNRTNKWQKKTTRGEVCGLLETSEWWCALCLCPGVAPQRRFS